MDRSQPQPAEHPGFVGFPAAHVEGTLASRFRWLAERHADRLAIQDVHQSLTYGELQVAAQCLGRGLLARGLDRRQPVALFLDQGAAFITALLGVLEAGGFYVPLDPRNPGARNAHMLSDSRAQILVTDAASRQRAERLRPPALLTLEELLENPAARDTGSDGSVDGNGRGWAPAAAGTALSLAYVLYTSGSTGKPKGVMQDHRSVLHNAMTHINSFRLGPGDRVSLLYPCSVYGGNRDIFNALLSGASLHRYPVERLGLAPLAAWLIQQRITVFCSVATLFRQFARHLSGEQFTDLRLIKLGGEVVFRTDVEMFQARFDGACLLSCGLGATEMGGVRQFFMGQNSALGDARIPCGFAVDGVDVGIVDGEGRPVPEGQEGEIMVTSDYLSTGYWQQRELTALTFGTAADGRRTYRTGDLGCLRRDGHLLHLGRADQQVKIHGNRVELAEIEAHLLEWEGAREAAVMAQPGAHGQMRLLACVAHNGEPSPGSDNLEAVRQVREHLARRLPAYMIPAQFVIMDDLPTLPNGKIDRAALQAVARLATPAAPAAPGTATETALAAIWAEVLERPNIGPLDDFFLSGGDSLALIQMLVLVEKRLGTRLDLAAIVEAPALSQLAARIDAAGAAGGLGPLLLTAADAVPRLSLVPIRAAGSRPPLFMAAPAGGSVLPYYTLAHRLGAAQPLHGLQIHLPREERRAVLDIPELAESFVRGLRTLQPHGPYRLGGWSFGGFLAFEIASRLRAAGQQVASLFIIDSDLAVAGRRRSLRTMVQDLRLFAQLLANSKFYVRDHLHLKLSASLQGTPGGSRSMPGWQRLLGRWLWRGGAGDANIAQFLAQDPRLIEMQHSLRDVLASLRIFMQSIETFKPAILDIDLDVLVPACGKRVAVEMDQGWQRVTTGRVRVHEVPGNHFSLFDAPHIDVLAQTLSRLLAGKTSASIGATADQAPGTSRLTGMAATVPSPARDHSPIR